MRRSKLEMYVDILKVLVENGPLKITHIMYTVNLNCGQLKEYLDFLCKQGFVEKKKVKKQAVFSVTQRGTTILHYFQELNRDLPIFEEAQTVLQYFNELSTETPKIEET